MTEKETKSEERTVYLVYMKTGFEQDNLMYAYLDKAKAEAYISGKKCPDAFYIYCIDVSE